MMKIYNQMGYDSVLKLFAFIISAVEQNGPIPINFIPYYTYKNK